MKIKAADVKTLVSMSAVDINAALTRNGYLDKYESVRFLGINGSGDVVYQGFYTDDDGIPGYSNLYVSIGINGLPVAEY